MFKEMAQLGSLLKQAQGLSGKMREAQERLAAARFSGSSDDGVVRIELTGQGQVVGCDIDDPQLSPELRTALENRVMAAVNAAYLQFKQRTAAEMSEATGGMDLGALGAGLGLGPGS